MRFKQVFVFDISAQASLSVGNKIILLPDMERELLLDNARYIPSYSHLGGLCSSGTVQKLYELPREINNSAVPALYSMDVL